MSFREFMQAIRADGQLLIIPDEVDPCLEMAALFHGLGERPTLVERVKGSQYPVVAGM